VLGNGPGSFIGMRIGASVAQGLAHGANLKIAPVSSMAAVAAEVGSSEPASVVVAQDAHMQEVYLGVYKVDGSNVTSIVPERLQRSEAIAELVDNEGCIAAGYGWQRYPDLLQANLTNLRGLAKVLYPRARFLLSLGVNAFELGNWIAAEDVNPAYLRQQVAEKPRITKD